MQDKENEYPEMVLVRFDKWIRIGRYKKKVIVAEYTEEDWFGKILLVSNNDLVTPKENELCLVFLPKKHSYPKTYHNEIGVFRVRIIMPETIGKIKVFKNIFIPESLFKNFNGSKAMVIIRDPNLERDHKTHLLRIATGNSDKEAVERFIKKNLLLEKTEIKESGIIEVTVESSEDPDYLKNNFLELLSDFVSKLSEA